MFSPRKNLNFFCCFILILCSCCQKDIDILQSDASEATSAPLANEVEVDRILVFNKTEGFRHQSIDSGINLIRSLGDQEDFIVDTSINASDFNTNNLSLYKAVVFLNTSGDILDSSQESAFQTFIQNGGSYMGVHAASDTEKDWPWYGQLVGAYFFNHPEIQEARISRIDSIHPSTKDLNTIFVRTDEWYNFEYTNSNIKVLLNLDESSYQGGTNGENHPIAWYHDFDGGRSFYTGGGHTDAAYDEPQFQQHILGGILYCLRREE